MSETVAKLDRDTAELQGTLKTILTAGQELDNKLLQLEHDLNVPSVVASDLKQITDSLATVDALLVIAELIPEISSEASTARKAIEAIKKPIVDAEDALNDFDNKIKPLKTTVKDAEQALSKFNTKVVEFQGKLTSYVTQIDDAQTCVDTLPNGSVKTNLQSDVDALASNSDKVVLQLNGLLQTAINNVNAAKNYIENTINPLLTPFEAMRKGLEALGKRLQGIVDPLSDRKKLMDYKISLSFDYPCGMNPGRVWPLPPVLPSVKFCNYSLGFTIRQILNGAEWLENEIKRILGDAILAAAEALGLGNLIKELEDKANAVINEAVNAISGLLKSLDIKIPGIADIKLTIQKFRDALMNLPDMLDIDFDAMEKLMQQIEDDITNAKEIYDACSKVGH